MKLLQLTLSLCAAYVAASSGDRLPDFQQCVSTCIKDSCPRELPLVLQLFLWTCESDCDYQCQQRVTDASGPTVGRVHQFHGKWPFSRLLGIQEPASVLFSILNFWPNYLGFQALKKTASKGDWRMKIYYLGFAIAGMNAWVWSTVFHTRDFVLTERLDYFSAMASITYGLALAMIRLYRLDRPSQKSLRRAVLGSVLAFYLFHISYLSFVKFDYGYNMAAGVTVGMAQNILWVVLSVRLYTESKNRMDLVPAVLILALLGGMSFELFDFAPFFRAVDAHSLWHAATILPTFYWYKWMVYDVTTGERSKKHQE